MLLAGVRMKDKRPVINWLAAPGVCVRACVCVCTTGLVFLVYLHWTMCVFIITPLSILSEGCQLHPGLVYTLHDSTGR